MKKQIVIVRFDEDLNWTQYLTEETIIYNKGPKFKCGHKIINVPNLGMGIGLYLYHIVENYDNLADITLFIQGWPFDGMFEGSMNFLPDIQGVSALEEFYFTLLDEHYASYNYFMKAIGDIFNCPPNYNQRTHKCFIYHSIMWQEWLETFIDPASKIDYNLPHAYYRNNHISLKKEAILSNSKEYYIKMLGHCKYWDPIVEWFTESTIAQIFNIDDSGKLTDFRHDLVDVSNLEDYKTWMYEIK